MIQRHDTSLGRFYSTPDGIFPSVTTVLSSIPNPGLDDWKKSIGEEKAKIYSLRASQRGTRMHEYCESVLKKETPKALDIFDRAWFKGLDSVLERIEPIAIEKTLYTTELEVAGTLDCFCRLDGKFCILDFKTASSMKLPGMFDSYWIQTSVYANMLKNRFNIDISNLCIVMQSDGETSIFWETADKWLSQFKEIRQSYKYDKQEVLDEIRKHQ